MKVTVVHIENLVLCAHNRSVYVCASCKITPLYPGKIIGFQYENSNCLDLSLSHIQ